MKLWILSLFILFGVLTSKVWASSQTVCNVTTGIYPNSQMNLGSFYFFSYADIFSLNNAKSFIIQLDGQELHLQREEMQTRGGTQMTFVGKTDQGNRKIFVLIDRSPKDALSTKTFLGNMIISPVKKDANITISDLMRERSAKTMNFSCSF